MILSVMIVLVMTSYRCRFYFGGINYDTFKWALQLIIRMQKIVRNIQINKKAHSLRGHSRMDTNILDDIGLGDAQGSFSSTVNFAANSSATCSCSVKRRFLPVIDS